MTTNLWCFALSLLSAFSCFAQSEVAGAAINGTDLDTVGAVVAGARVVATNDETGFTREKVTNEAGL
ncbi:MAG: hypothetical protein WKF37_20485 [Bryobacteraceae bacterium]